MTGITDLFIGGDTLEKHTAIIARPDYQTDTVGLPLPLNIKTEKDIYEVAYSLGWKDPQTKGWDTDCIAVGMALRKYRSDSGRVHVEEVKHLSHRVRYGILEKEEAKNMLMRPIVVTEALEREFLNAIEGLNSMISFNAPLFISVEMNDESVYKKMLIKSDNSNGLLPSQTLKALRAYVCENKPFGISLYGNLQNTNSKDFLEYCYMNDIPLGYDLSCNKSTYDWIISNKNYFQLFRIVLFSLQSELNDRLFENNCIEDIMYFVKSDIFFDKGKVIVLPVTTENLNEVERIMVFALDNNYKINPLPLPYDSAIQLGLTTLII